jgi:UDP-N-acetyl-D-mannosaminuronic acid transferase (WecB/TagA/CpsF family)
MDRNGGFLVIPAASALCQAAEDENLWGALLSADYAIMDSGYLSLLLKFRRSPRPPRISGFQLLENLICADPVINIRERRILWVAPDCDEEDRIASHLAQHGFRPELQRYYNAPFYEREEDFHDTALLEIAGEFCPQWIVLCIGGGRQEKLGAFLRQQIGREAAIIGSGAAIGFFTGGQAPITRGIDRLYLGWLVRILHDPRRFLPRYAAAVKLPWLLHRLGAVKSSN